MQEEKESSGPDAAVLSCRWFSVIIIDNTCTITLIGGRSQDARGELLQQFPSFFLSWCCFLRYKLISNMLSTKFSEALFFLHVYTNTEQRMQKLFFARFLYNFAYQCVDFPISNYPATCKNILRCFMVHYIVFSPFVCCFENRSQGFPANRRRCCAAVQCFLYSLP